MRECFCFGSEAVNASGEAVRGLVKSRVENNSENFSRASPARNMAASPAHASRQLRRLGVTLGSLSTRVFETRTATGSELFPLLTCPYTTTFTLLGIFFAIRDG